MFRIQISSSKYHEKMDCFPTFGYTKSSVEWETNGEHIASISETNIYIWNVEQPDTPSISSTSAIDSKSSAIHKLSCCRWNPHMSTNQLATTLGPHIRGWDLRSMK